jgi:hypothetical protein
MENKKYPENNRLISLLNIWSQNRLENDYELVMHELMEGKACLLLPSINNEAVNYGWRVTDGKTSLKLTCIYEVEGIKSLGVFSDEGSLRRWAKKPQTYTAMKSQDVLKLCEANDIYYLIINSDSPNIFVGQRFTNK